MYVKRHLEEQVRYASKYYPAVMVCGQRQASKSTMLHTIKTNVYHILIFVQNRR